MKKIDFDHWERREHFAFFSKFDEPYYGIVSEIECTKVYKLAKKWGDSFFASYLHKALTAANGIPEMKQRIIDGDIYEFDVVHASPTIGRPDDTFAFSFIPFSNDFLSFAKAVSAEVKEVQSTSGLCLSENTWRKDVIHFSSIPWISFTGLSHPRNFKSDDSAPKVTFGKMTIRNKQMFMPVAVHVHHGLMDGRHVALYVELFQKLMNEV
ncbi:MAG: chloramphenicol acetyltransferase [Bacteroidetes bacterium]|nr:chloramphenicol acetyltransferase [Bacteroidota bacterium]